MHPPSQAKSFGPEGCFFSAYRLIGPKSERMEICSAGCRGQNSRDLRLGPHAHFVGVDRAGPVRRLVVRRPAVVSLGFAAASLVLRWHHLVVDTDAMRPASEALEGVVTHLITHVTSLVAAEPGRGHLQIIGASGWWACFENIATLASCRNCRRLSIRLPSCPFPSLALRASSLSLSLAPLLQ